MVLERTNATPNLNNGNVFIGDATNHSVARALVVADTTGLQAALDDKVDDSQVLTNVPSGAVFTDTNTTYTVGDGGLTTNDFTDADHSKLNAIEADATADQTKADIEGLGIDVPAVNLTGTIPAARLSTATTQAESDDSTKIATTAYVVDKITTLIGGAPDTLNDLNELAAAINDDNDYHSTLTTALGTKLPKAGGTMTGDINLGSNDISNIRSLQLNNLELTDLTEPLQIMADANDTTAPASLGTWDGSSPDGLYMRSYAEGVNYTIYHTGHFSGTHIANWQTAYGWGDHASAGYTNDQTAAEILTKVKTVDGSGSGLDADLLDGLQASQFLRSDAADTMTSQLIFSGASPQIKFNDTDADDFWIHANSNNFYVLTDRDDNGSWEGANPLLLQNSDSQAYVYGQKVWNQGNDGAGSGLDADLLDGQQGSYYYPASNPNGYTSSVGDITGVTAGAGLTGGGTSGAVTINLSAVQSPALAQELSSSVNLDTLNSSAAGFYYQSSNADTSGNNYPSGQAGSLLVQKSAGNATQIYVTYDTSPEMYIRSNYTAGYTAWNKVFHTGNDGSGSGLDADTLDGQHASAFLTPTGDGSQLTGVQPFPTGTVMVFYQAAAPTGWTKSTSHNNKALRVVSGNGGGSGGTHGLSSPPSTAHTHTETAHTHSIGAHSHGNNLSAAAHTLSTAQMPSHNHNVGKISAGYSSSASNYYSGNQHNPSSSTGGGGSHSHGMSGSVSNSAAYNSGSAGGGATGSAGPTAFAPQYVDVIICSKN